MTLQLTVIIPVYNEAATIDELLARVLNAPLTKEVIVVDDASTDTTVEKLKAWNGRVVVLSHHANRGKGAAIRTALPHADGIYTLIQDADLEYDPKDYSSLVYPLLNRESDAVYGSRYLRSQPWSVCRMGVLLLNWVVRWVYRVKLTDQATCYKLFRSDDLRAMELQCEGFEFCAEVTAKACRMGLRIKEVAISYQPRSVADGKKIRWRDGWAALRSLWQFRRWQARPRPPVQATDLSGHSARSSSQCEAALLADGATVECEIEMKSRSGSGL